MERGAGWRDGSGPTMPASPATHSSEQQLAETADCYTMTAPWCGRWRVLGLADCSDSSSVEDVAGSLAPGTVRVSDAGTGALSQTITNGRHEWTADEPASHGGGDRGPTPYERLSGSLGACVAITVRMYADRKGWPLDNIIVEVSHVRVHADDCDDPDGNCGKVDVFRKLVELQGDLDEAQRARLAQIADRCPVHRTLAGSIRIETRFV
jgi:putative redox protein